MSSIYPSLEDMKFHQLTIAQKDHYLKQNVKFETNTAPQYPRPSAPECPSGQSSLLPTAPALSFYPSANLTHSGHGQTPQPATSPYYPNQCGQAFQTDTTTYHPTAPAYPTLSSPYLALQSHTSYPIVPNMPSAPLSPSESNAVTTKQSSSKDFSSLYPSLENYMDLEAVYGIIQAELRENETNEVENMMANSTLPNIMKAPLSARSPGLQKAHVTNGIRELVLCKDGKGVIGVRICIISQGVFVCLVESGSPAALAGLRFGDQILQINDVNVAGYKMKQVHLIFKNAPVNNIKVVIRDRPFERNVSLHKDSSGHFGFQFKDGQIVRLVKDSSASRNGLLIDHQIMEIDGRNVVGMKDKNLRDIFEKSQHTITLTIMPTFVYEHMIKKTSTKLFREKMDHSI